MIATETLRLQHDAALDMSCTLLDLIDAFQDEEDVFPILRQFNKLLGLLRIHLTQEDVQLYTPLMSCDDEKVASLARAYFAEMGGLAADLEQFARSWSCSVMIAADFDEFRDGALNLVHMLAVRIERENRYLYPLADAFAEARRGLAA